MHWSKIAAIAMIVTILTVVGIFGSHFGYSDSGIALVDASAIPKIVSIKQWPPNELSFIVTFDTGYMKTMTYAELKNYLDAENNDSDVNHGAVQFLKDLATFSIPRVPIFVSAIFDILLILLLVLIIITFTPLIPGGD